MAANRWAWLALLWSACTGSAGAPDAGPVDAGDPNAPVAFEAVAGVPSEVLGELVDLAFADDGRAALASKDYVFLSDDHTTWRRISSFNTAAIRAVAIRPDGQQIFAGSAAGQYALVRTSDDHSSPSFTVTGAAQSEDIQQAIWMPAPRGNGLLYVSTSSADSLQGRVASTAPLDDDQSDWAELSPLAPLNPPAGYFGLARASLLRVAYRKQIDLVQRTGVRELNLNSTDGWYEARQSEDEFLPALSLSYARHSGTLASVYAGDRLYLDINGAPQVARTGAPGVLRVARFDADDRLWLVTDAGVFRSVNTLGR